MLCKKLLLCLVVTCGCIHTLTAAPIATLYAYYLKKYDALSKEQLDELRTFWKSDKFASKLKDDAVVKTIVEFADHLRQHYPKNMKIYALGQSPAYLVLTAQMLDALMGGNQHRYGFVAFSGMGGASSQGLTVETDLSRAFKDKNEFEAGVSAYYWYLQSLNFLPSELNFLSSEKEIVMVEQAESGASIAGFKFILDAIKKYVNSQAPIPTIKWYIQLSPSYVQRLLYNDIQGYRVPKTDEEKKNRFIYEAYLKRAYRGEKEYKDYVAAVKKYQPDVEKFGTFSEIQSYVTELIKKLLTKPMENIIQGPVGTVTTYVPSFDFYRTLTNYPAYPGELNATDNENLRLVASYTPRQWGEIDPLDFVPHKEADMLVLRIIDYIKQNLINKS